MTVRWTEGWSVMLVTSYARTALLVIIYGISYQPNNVVYLFRMMPS
jgi:hypothetical protein